jgi:hypothetical protein
MGSRYLAGVYEEDASEAVRVVENLFKLIEVIEDNVFSKRRSSHRDTDVEAP